MAFRRTDGGAIRVTEGGGQIRALDGEITPPAAPPTVATGAGSAASTSSATAIGASLAAAVGSAAGISTAAAVSEWSGGLYNQVMSATPTDASTGLTNWGNQNGASVADRATGVTLTIPSNASNDSWSIRYKTAPSAPYTIKALLALSAFSLTGDNNAGIGWYDGTKAHLIRLFQSGSAAPSLIVTRYSDLNTWNSNADFAGSAGQATKLIWMRLRVDGSGNVYFEASLSGDDNDFESVYSVAAASGYLAGSYSNVFFGGACKGAEAKVTLLSYAEGT